MRYSVDLRRRVVSAVRDDGMSKRAASRRFKVGKSAVYEWLALGDDLAGGICGLKEGIKLKRKALEASVVEEPDLTHAERGRRFGVHAATICRALRKHGVSYKKKPLAIANVTL